jgi:hypothetical protein
MQIAKYTGANVFYLKIKGCYVKDLNNPSE